MLVARCCVVIEVIILDTSSQSIACRLYTFGRTGHVPWGFFPILSAGLYAVSMDLSYTCFLYSVPTPVIIPLIGPCIHIKTSSKAVAIVSAFSFFALDW